MASLLALFVSYLVLVLLAVCSWTVLPTLTGVHDPHVVWSNFLPWPPGIAIAFVAGATGGLLNGLLDLWRISAGALESAPSIQPAAVNFLLRPCLGALTSVFLFFLNAAGGLSLVDPRALAPVDPSAPSAGSLSIGALLYRLSPTTGVQLATQVTYGVVSGFFFPVVPEIFAGLRKTVFGGKTI